ncbi:hypothetical protein CASFOL_016952 [Castilleja foliolosa]|uniref:Uncharacterized protein n=1 Tax=Castilleja foliolosa TaxID=1961234 RepID=A0ABD3D9N6_9LAMI
MEALILRGSSMDKSISPHKPQIRNPRKIHPFISNHSENLSPPNLNTVGLLQPPPPFLSHSYPPYLLQQPPLLPLPAAKHRLSPVAAKNPNGGNNRKGDTSLTPPKKSKAPKKLAEKSSERVIGSPTPGHLKPDPKDLSNNVARVVINKPFVSSNMFDDANNQVALFSGSAMFTISPPPSSLPLPTFSLRPKISCRAAAGIDDGATDDLRRLLRLR